MRTSMIELKGFKKIRLVASPVERVGQQGRIVQKRVSEEVVQFFNVFFRGLEKGYEPRKVMWYKPCS